VAGRRRRGRRRCSERLLLGAQTLEDAPAARRYVIVGSGHAPILLYDELGSKDRFT
jgi:hypothetical protein